MTSLPFALHAATARPRHGSSQAFITLTRRPLSVSRALHVLSFCVLCLAPPAVDLLKALGRCVCTRGLLLLLSANIALLMLPLSFFLGVGASSLSLAGLMFKATRRGSFSLLFAVASAARAYATGLPHLFAYVALLLLPLSFFLGVCAPSVFLAGFMF